MTARTLEQANAALDALIARVNALDGQGLSDQAEALVPLLQSELEGLRQTVNQTFLVLESEITDIAGKLDNAIALLYQHLGLPTPV